MRKLAASEAEDNFVASARLLAPSDAATVSDIEDGAMAPDKPCNTGSVVSTDWPVICVDTDATMSVSQSMPLYPLTQLQLYDAIASTHVPPC